MADLLAEQARLRPALDRLLHLAAGWTDPVTADDSVAVDKHADKADAGTLPPRALDVMANGSAMAPRETGGAGNRATASPVWTAGPGALSDRRESSSGSRNAAPGLLPAADTGSAEQAAAVAADNTSPLPRFRLAPAPGLRVAPHRAAMAGAMLGVTASAPTVADDPVGVAWMPPAFADAVNAPSAAARWPMATHGPSPDPLAPLPALPAAWRATGTGSIGSAETPIQGSGPIASNGYPSLIGSAHALGPAIEAELEERIADILERAAIEAGIDLP